MGSRWPGVCTAALATGPTYSDAQSPAYQSKSGHGFSRPRLLHPQTFGFF
jgi:hypothetical protein